MIGSCLPPAGKSLMVGKPWISSGTSLAVASTLAMVTLALAGYMAASSSYLGARLWRKGQIPTILNMRLKGLLRFAVTAPGSVKFEKNIVLIVQNNLFVVFGHNDLDRALLLLRNRL